MQVEPYLFLEGRCDEAIEFYRKAFGAELTMLMRFSESPEPPACESAGNEDKVMHAEILIGKTTLMLSDGLCQGPPNFQGFSLSLSVADETDAERLFTELSEGGEVQMPLGKTFWSPLFGLVADRFGVSCMIHVEK